MDVHRGAIASKRLSSPMLLLWSREGSGILPLVFVRPERAVDPNICRILCSPRISLERSGEGLSRPSSVFVLFVSKFLERDTRAEVESAFFAFLSASFFYPTKRKKS